jgi:hypothetical protein
MPLLCDGHAQLRCAFLICIDVGLELEIAQLHCADKLGSLSYIEMLNL